MESGQISTAINAAWKKGGMELVLSTITKMREDHKEV